MPIIGPRINHLRLLWREGLWGRWIALAYAAASLFVFIRDDFWRPTDADKWALINLIPHLPLGWWTAGALLILLAWSFEASFLLRQRETESASARIAGLEKEKLTREQKAVRKIKLAGFMQEGLQLQSACTDESKPPPEAEAHVWYDHLNTFLESVDASYLARLHDSSALPLQVTQIMKPEHKSLWMHLRVYTFNIGQFLKEMS